MTDVRRGPGLADDSELLESMATGYFALDENDCFRTVNAQMETILGLTRDEVIGRRMWDLFPEAETLAFGIEYRIARETGSIRVFEAWAPRLRSWLELRVVPHGKELRVYVLDVTSRRESSDRADAATARLRLIADAATELASTLDAEEAVGRLVRLLVPHLGEWALVTLVEDDGSMRDLGSAHADPAKDAEAARYAALRLASLQSDAVLFSVARSGVAETVDSDAAAIVAGVLAPGEARDILLRLDPQAMAVLPMQARGRSVGLISLYAREAFTSERLETAATIAERAGVAIDNARAYSRMQAAQASATLSARRIQLLSDVSELLSASLDQGLGVARLARLVVPALADWCIVSVTAVEGLDRDLGWAHRDPMQEELLAEYAREHVGNARPDSAMAVCLRTGEPVIVTDMPDTLLNDWVADGSALSLLSRLRPSAVTVLPLQAGGQTLGAMALVTLSDRGPQTLAELETSLEVARRAGLALDNARLYGRQRHLAETLQRSLLTDPPAVPGIEIAVRYVPAATEAQVGGDWYDAYSQADGQMVLVIGDVIGHDTRAAAAMGQLRSLLRGIGYATGAGPSALLTRLDETIEGLQLLTSATAVVVRLEGGATTPDGLDLTRPSRLRWSNAGHPPPMLVTATGSVQLLDAGEADLLLGIDAGTERREQVAELPAGATLILYTDGLVERRGMSLDDGLADLRSALADYAGAPLEQLCDLVITRLLPPGAEDDVAVVAVRVRD